MKRNNSLDCLRVLACFLVILLHVSAGYVIDNIENYNFQFTIGNFFDSISRICVPLFVMLSGAFLLENSKNKNFSNFYKKSLLKVGIPTFIWSLIYVIYSYVIGIGREMIRKEPFDYLSPIKNWVMGRPFYHLWYLYMIIGLYILTPIIIRLKEEIKEKTFFLISIILLILSIGISVYNSLVWLIQFILYLGYFMMGSFLKNYFMKKTFNLKVSILISILSGISIFVITEYFVKYNLFNKTLYFYGNLTPFVIIGSIFTFITFLNLKIESNLYTSLAHHSFNIYLIHAGFLSTLNIILDILNLKFNGIWYIPLTSLIIFIISYIGSKIISVILNKILLKIPKLKVAYKAFDKV